MLHFVLWLAYLIDSSKAIKVGGKQKPYEMWQAGNSLAASPLANSSRASPERNIAALPPLARSRIPPATQANQAANLVMVTRVNLVTMVTVARPKERGTMEANQWTYDKVFNVPKFRKNRTFYLHGQWLDITGHQRRRHSFMRPSSDLLNTIMAATWKQSKSKRYIVIDMRTTICTLERFSFECGKVIGFAFAFGFHATWLA